MSPYARATRPDGGIEKYPREMSTVNPLWLSESGTVDDHDTYGTLLLKGHVLVTCPWVEGLTYRLNLSHSLERVERDPSILEEGYRLGREAAETHLPDLFRQTTPSLFRIDQP